MPNKIIIAFALCLAAGSLGLQRAAAQAAPASAQFSAPVRLANGAIQHPATKVVRIYGGAGYFDNALAEKLRPMLTKAFGTSRPDAPKAVPGAAVAAPAKSESQDKLTLAAHP